MMISQFRRGYSLIELMLVLSMFSVLMTLAVTWINQSMKFGSTIQSRQTHHHSLQRFAHQLREDLHRSLSAVKTDSKTLTLQLMTETVVVYQFMDAKVVRTLSKASKPVHFESYGFVAGTPLEWIVDESGSRAGVQVFRSSYVPEKPHSLSGENSPKVFSSDALDLFVYATVGRCLVRETPLENQSSAVGSSRLRIQPVEFFVSTGLSVEQPAKMGEVPR